MGLLVTAPELTEETELVLLDRCRSDPFAEVITTAAAPLLARSKLAAEVREVLVQRAGADGDPAVRRAAVTLLAREAEPVRRPEVFRDLIRRDPAPGVIRAAAEALTTAAPAATTTCGTPWSCACRTTRTSWSARPCPPSCWRRCPARSARRPC